jgi:pilus assembly protein CpaB
VLLTTSSAVGQRSEVILSDVRVLAIGKQLGEMGVTGGDETGTEASPTPTTFENSTIATLELDPAEAETLVNASTRGQLSLTLRSVADFNNNDAGPATANQAVRLIRYGKEQSVMAGSSSSDVAQGSTDVMGASDSQNPVAPETPQVLPQ